MPNQLDEHAGCAAHGVGNDPTEHLDYAAAKKRHDPANDAYDAYDDPVIDVGRGLIAAINSAAEALNRLAAMRQGDPLPAPMGGFAAVGGLEPMRPSDVFAAAMRAQNQYDAASPTAWSEQIPVVLMDMESLGITGEVKYNCDGRADQIVGDFKGLSIYVGLAPTPRPNPAEPLTLSIGTTDGVVVLRSHTTSHAGLLQTLRGFIAGLQAQQPPAVSRDSKEYAEILGTEG